MAVIGGESLSGKNPDGGKHTDCTPVDIFIAVLSFKIAISLLICWAL